MATQDNLNFVQQLYVAYYGRPAESAGLQYWAERADTDGQGTIITAFGESREFQDEYGNLDNEALVNNLYQQLFGRDAEPAGLAYYTGVLDRGEKALSEIAVTIFNSAENEDEDVFDARVDVANGYTEQFGGNAYNAQDGKDAILAVVPDDSGSEGGNEPVVDETLISELQNLQDVKKAVIDYLETLTEDGSPVTGQELYQRFQAAEDALDQAEAQKPTGEIDAEYKAAKTQREQSREAVDGAFTKTGVAGEDATQGEIQTELVSLENAVNQAGGKVEHGVAQPSGSAGLEVKSYNDFDDVVDTFTTFDNALYRDEGNPSDELFSTRQEVDEKVGKEPADFTDVEARQTLIQQKLDSLPSGNERNEFIGLVNKLNTVRSEFNQLKVERDAVLEQVGEAFTETAFDGDVPKDQDIKGERVALQAKVEAAGGEVNTDSGSLRAYADNATGVEESKAYNDFKNKADALKTAQDDFADAQQAQEARDALYDEINLYVNVIPEEIASYSSPIVSAELSFGFGGGLYDLPTYAEGSVSATGDEDLFLFYGASATITGFDGQDGDRLFIGEQFTRMNLAKDVDIGATAQGNDSALEVFFQQAGNDAVLNFEDAVGEGGATNNPYMAEVTLTGINVDNLSVESGFVSIA